LPRVYTVLRSFMYVDFRMIGLHCKEQITMNISLKISQMKVKEKKV